MPSPKPVTPDPPVTLADHQKLQHELKVVRGKLGRAHTEINRLEKLVESLKTQKTATDTLMQTANVKIEDLTRQLEAAPRALVDAPIAADSGPSADDPRWMYPADDTQDGFLFENLAAAERAEERQPGHWHASPDGALAAYMAKQNTVLTD